tara:strand:+ start:759 stop:1772 length:1014 start_codon:yes stop_codon:yes gene_type:complete
LKNEISVLRYLYKDVINGYSIVEEEAIHISHLKETDIGSIEERRIKLAEEARGKGLQSEEEKVNLLISQGLWTQEKEEDIEKLKKEIIELQETKKKLILGRQIKQINNRIEFKSKVYNELVKERSSEVGHTAEKHAEKKVNEELVFKTFFKGPDLTEPFFSNEEFDELTNKELDSYALLYTAVNSQYSDLILRKISVCPFFLNSFFVCENNTNLFYGKPVVELTNYQIDVFSYGRYYKSIMSEAKSPPNELYSEPEKLIEYYENAKKAKEAKENRKNNRRGKESEYMGSTVFGATKEELEVIAGEEDGSSEMLDLSKEAEKSGGEMGLNEFLNLHKK